MGLTTTRSWGGAVGIGVPGLVAGMALSWALGLGARTPAAQAQVSPSAAATRAEPPANGTIAFTTTNSGTNQQLLYLVDTRAQAFAIYKVDPQKGEVKLEAARPYHWDLKLQYNNRPPDVSAVEAMVSSQGQGVAPTTRR